MKKIIFIAALILIAIVPLSAQDTYYSIFSYNYFIPEVKINDYAVSLQKSIYPNVYNSRSVSTDMKWVNENDSALVGFWNQKGDTILHILTELAGIEWVETEFDIYFVRYYPTVGSSDPVILPIGGINNGVVIEAMPDIDKQKLLLIFQLARRMLHQSHQPQENIKLSLAYHPLMQPTAYRFDNMAMLLAIATAYSILGVEPTINISRSLYWKQKFPGEKIFSTYIEPVWMITPDQTLADLIAAEPRRSQLVTMTRTPKLESLTGSYEQRKYIKDLPLKGQFGFTLKYNSANQMIVTNIDTYRLAYACGLRTDDIIRRVDGKVARNFKQVIEMIRERFEEGGSVVTVIREGRTMEVIMQPLEIDYSSDEYYFDEFNQEDTLYFDSTLIDPEE